MYRVIEMSGQYYAVELLSSGRTWEDEKEEIEQYASEGTDCIITDDYEKYDAKFIERNYLE